MESEATRPVDAATSPSGETRREEAAPRRSWKDGLIHEVRTHPFGYGVLAAALVIGPVLLMMIFPEITTVQAIVGGLAFGVYAALCAVPQKFM